MKRYLVFAYDNMYPSGGMDDFKFSFNTKEKAAEMLTYISVKNYDYIQFFDCETNLRWDYKKEDFPSENEEVFNESFNEVISRFINFTLSDY
jgi:hypothetical protein